MGCPWGVKELGSALEAPDSALALLDEGGVETGSPINQNRS